MLSKTIKSNRKAIFLVAVLTGLFLVAYFPVLKSLFNSWVSLDDYSHGFFIIPICIYIVFQKRKHLNGIPESRSWWGLLFIILVLGIYIMARLAGILTIVSLSLIFMLAGMIIFFFGFPMLRELLFPLAFLLFMIPIPDQVYSQVTIPLQLFVTKVSVWFTAHIGIPIYREGNVIHLPNRSMEVAKACSGLRSMISILPLGAILGYFTISSNPLRWILFLSGIPTAIIVNIVRVILLVMAFYFFNLDLTAGTTHTIFGLFVFILALIILFFIRGILSKWNLTYTGK